MSCDQNAVTSVSRVLTSCSGTKLFRSTCWLAAPTHMIRRSSTICALSPSALSSASVLVLKPVCGFLHGGLFTKDDRTGLHVTLDLEVSSEATEGEFGSCRVIREGWGLDKMLSTPEFWRAGAQD